MTRLSCMLSLAVVFTLCQIQCHGQSGESLAIYTIDVGSGSAVLIISPSGQTMLIDAGTPEAANRILDVIKQAGVKQIDYMVTSHYHSDHMGGVPYLARNIRIVNYVDHGQNVEYGKSDE